MSGKLRSRFTWLAVGLAIAALPYFAHAQSVRLDAVTTGPNSCAIPATTVAAFFEGGAPTLNAVAKPADSTVILSPNCGFFQWAEQMFLWLTSPAPATYGGGSHVMFSPQFFIVSPEDSTGRRSFIKNSPGLPIRMFLRAMELGPHGLPMVMARSGHIVEVRRETRGQAPPRIRLANGRLVSARTVTSVRTNAQGTLELLDARGNVLTPRRPVLRPLVPQQVELAPRQPPTRVVPADVFQNAIQARRIIIKRIPIFIDPAGDVIDVEPGEADSAVLLSQNGSLIYFITAVNGIFAYHRTMQGPALIPVVNTISFPLVAADATPVVSFASTKGFTIKDPQALAIETKSSWIDVSAVANPNDYIQVTAVVPTFNKSNPNNWVVSGQATVKLAMLGLHVVGSTQNHGEMIWSTFEHVNNAPDTTYAYFSTAGSQQPQTVLQNTVGTWLFTPSGSMGPFNSTTNSWTGTAITGNPVGPAAIIRAKPWGSNDGGIPANAASLNTQVISANASVIQQLDPMDVRAKYFQLGATWSIPGPSLTPVGTTSLANTTMETFAQGKTSSDASSNCFSCHSTKTVSVSHVYRELRPLP